MESPPSVLLISTMSANKDEGPPALRVLVVDDYPDAAESLATLLRLAGFDAMVALNGSASLEIARTFWPDVVLLDLAMPGMDGYVVAKRLREMSLGRDKPWLIAVTGNARKEDRERSLAEGMDEHFTKPADPVALVEWLKRIANQ
jgi:CheY-like chemotaxis protein